MCSTLPSPHRQRLFVLFIEFAPDFWYKAENCCIYYAKQFLFHNLLRFTFATLHTIELLNSGTMRTIQIVRAALAASIVPLASAGDPVNNNVQNKPAGDPVNNHVPDELTQYDKVVPPPGPVQPGALVDKCGAWVEALPGATCYSLAESLGVGDWWLELQNPQLQGDCPKNLWAGYYYCKGLVRPSKPNLSPDPKITAPPPPPPRKSPDPDCVGAYLDKCATAVFTASETPGPMIDWYKRTLPACVHIQAHLRWLQDLARLVGVSLKSIHNLLDVE
ncbi:hypothetical protein F4859DRAFT_522469 [Xylaria cf. heliscus]|nr:hypothetical protein F4859DRAFT_522469 [Xylaria cf. heliscus]